MELKTIRLDLIDPNPNQPRESLGDLTTLVDSIKKRGVLVPILVMATGITRYLTIAGHRRTGAARIAGESEIPAIIAADWTEADRLLATMAENTVRLDMTAIEIAAGYQTLLDLKVDPDDIAKATGGLSAEAVTAAAKVLPSIIGSEKYNQITIEQMVALNEFDGDKKSLKKLLAAIESGRNFDYDLKSVRQARERGQKVAAVKAELKAAGMRVIPEPNYMPGSPKNLEHYPSWGTPEEHASCPGHCAYVNYAGEPRYACDQPEIHGHQSTVGGQISKAAREQQEADRAARKVDWENAAEVRREFVKTQVTDNSVAGALFDWAVDRVETTDLARGTDSRDELFGVLKTSLARLVGLAVAQMEITKYNRGIMDLYDAPGYVSTTMYNGSANYIKYVRYLNVLIKVGYTATPPEQTFLDNVAALIASEVAEESAREAARITIDCALCSENEVNDGDCTPGDDGHPDANHFEAEINADGTVDSCFCAMGPDDDASVETTDEAPETDTDAEGAHEGEIGTPSTEASLAFVPNDAFSSTAASQLWKRALDEGTAKLNLKGVGALPHWDIHLTLTIADVSTEASIVRFLVAGIPGKFPTDEIAIATKLGIVGGVTFDAPTQGIGGLWAFEALLEADCTEDCDRCSSDLDSGPMADARISKEFAQIDADRILIAIANGDLSAQMHWNAKAVYTITSVERLDDNNDTEIINVTAHPLRPIRGALTDARLFADRYAEAMDFETAGLTVEGSTITLKFAAKGGE